jgi:hypothetical protein
MGKWSASHSSHLTPRKRASETHCIEGWVGPRARLGMVVKRKIPGPCRELNPGHPACSLVTILTELFQLLKTYKKLIKMSFNIASRSVMAMPDVHSSRRKNFKTAYMKHC